MGIPVIVGVEDAMATIEDSTDITIDGSTGSVHQGHASVL